MGPLGPFVGPMDVRCGRTEGSIDLFVQSLRMCALFALWGSPQQECAKRIAGLSCHGTVSPLNDKGKLPLGGPSRSVLGPLGAPRAPEDTGPCPKGPGEAPDSFELNIASNGVTGTRFRPFSVFSGSF